MLFLASLDSGTACSRSGDSDTEAATNLRSPMSRITPSQKSERPKNEPEKDTLKKRLTSY